MGIREALARILSEYPTAKAKPLEGHALAQFIRKETASAVSEALGSEGDGFIIQGSPGQGNWAAVPWISIFDPTVTTSATRGYYVVYLFHATDAIVQLSLNQGTTAVREEFRSAARGVLADRAQLMRKRVSEFQKALPTNSIDLGSEARLPGDYGAGHVLGTTYTLATLPAEHTLQADLHTIVRAYRALTFRGGTEGDPEPQFDLSDVFTSQTSITETRKYVYHRKIERNRTAAASAKKFHGTICQACNLDFGERYGAIGQGFIEAHHLKPISELEEGVPVRYDIALDFAVLCSNCHKMIHRTEKPSDLEGFKKLIQ